MKFQIDPNPQIIVALVVAVLTLAAKGTVALPMGVPPIVGEYITSWSNWLLQLYAVIAPVLLSYTSSKPGPLAPADPVAVVAAQAAVDASKADQSPHAVQTAKDAAVVAVQSLPKGT